MKHIDTIALQGSIAEMRYRIASEQGAMHKVRLGVARWRGPVAIGDHDNNTPACTASTASQLRWHAEAQCQFICWLEQGGFAHEEATADSRASAAAASAVTAATATAATTATTATAATAQGKQPASKGIMAQAEQSATPISPAHCHGCTA